MFIAEPLAQKKLFKAIVAVDIAVTTAVSAFGMDPDWDERRGGFFCLQGVGNLYPFLVMQIGEVRRDKITKYMAFSQEKARRLADRVHLGEVSSWQSRNESQDKWGGAVRVDDLIFSLSGLPELGDEAVSLTAAILYSDGSPRVIDLARGIAMKNNNPYFRKMLVGIIAGHEHLTTKT